MDADKRAAVCPTADAHGHGDAGRMAGRLFDVNAHDGICAVDILSALNLWTTHPLSSGLPLFLIPELRAVSVTSGNPRSSASRHKAACRLRRQAIYTRST